MPSDAPRCATSSAICSAFRVAVPSSSIAAVKLASPGLSSGFASLPVRKHEIGRDDRQTAALVQDQGQTVGQRLRHWRGQLQRPGRAGLRHLVPPRFVGVNRSLPSPAAAFGAGGVAICDCAAGSPGTTCITTRAVGAS